MKNLLSHRLIVAVIQLDSITWYFHQLMASLDKMILIMKTFQLAGEYDVFNTNNDTEQRTDIAERISHENYDPDSKANDICLMRVI